MTMPLEPDVAVPLEPEAVLAGTKLIEGRSLGRIAWTRLRRDRVAMAGGVVVALLVFIAIFGPQLASIEGANTTDIHTNLIDPNLQIPLGGMGGISGHHWLGIDMPLGRDMFARITYGARVSLGIAGGATVLAIVIGVLLGMVAGYFGGWVDAVISRIMDVFLAFPVLIFAISLIGVVQDKAFGLSGNTLHIAVLVFVIGFFSWPYIGRIVRGQTLAIKEREYIEAARSLGAGPARIIFREIFPNLIPQILVYTTLLIPTNILFEAALSFLGVGIKDPMPSWGSMLNQAISFYQPDPEYLIVSGMAIFISVLAFNLLGDGLRDALDPRGSR
jgi:peptide/nickel transport system permease protein